MTLPSLALEEPSSAKADSGPSPRHKYLVTLKLPRQFQFELDGLRQALDPEGLQRIPSHVTLVPPFSSTRDVRSIAYHLETACSSFQPFFVMPQGIDLSFPKPEVIALKVAPAAYVGRLAQHLALQLRPLMETDGRIRVGTLLKRRFLPHITIGRSQIASARETAARQVNRHLVNRPAHVEGVELWRLEKAVWKPHQEVQFQGRR
jgi:2'-5' RNA ligase